MEHQVPLLQEVRDVSLTVQGSYALVSYENKAPPQAWRIGINAEPGKHELTLAHTYFTKNPVDFAGPSYFGGENRDDRFVLSASTGGEVYIWERASGVLLHSFKAQESLNHEFTNIAWNHKSPNGCMFALAARDGRVHIWTTTVPPSPQQNPALLSGSAGARDSASIRQGLSQPGTPLLGEPKPPAIKVSSGLP